VSHSIIPSNDVNDGDDDGDDDDDNDCTSVVVVSHSIIPSRGANDVTRVLQGCYTSVASVLPLLLL
jgi:hypothetical protein